MKRKPTNEGQEVATKQVSAAGRSNAYAAREAARAQLREAGVLVTDLEIAPDIAPASDEELEQLGMMRPGARSSEELVATDRGR